MSRSAVNSVALALALAAGLKCQTSVPGNVLSDTERKIDDLRQVSAELKTAVKTFYTHLDQAVEQFDRGYRTGTGESVQGADTDLNGVPADVSWSAIQRLFSFRMMATRYSRSPPAPVADLEHIQQLIVETRKRVDASDTLLRRLLVVSAADFDPQTDAAMKVRHDQLLKARAAAEDAARRAILSLPLDQADESATEETAGKAWDLLGRGSPAQNGSGSDVIGQTPPRIPIRFERRRRVTLISEPSFRMALTDSGVEDGEGRHIFYQEEWVQRGQSVIRYRCRVAVDTLTGEHVLLKRYPARELQGALADLYRHRDRDYLWYLEPADTTEPTRDQIESALVEVVDARGPVRAAARDFNKRIREALAYEDALHAAANKPLVDAGLPEGLRQTLFAIRAHLARVASVIDAESHVRGVISQAETAVRDLEPLAAWANRTDMPGASGVLSPKDWAQLLNLSDQAISSLRNTEAEALAGLPPDSSQAEQQFPALDRNVIIRMRRGQSKNPHDPFVQCRQEVWRLETGPLGTRNVARVVSLILIDPRSGDQTRIGGGTRYYKVSPGELLEEIFDEFAADEVSAGPS